MLPSIVLFGKEIGIYAITSLVGGLLSGLFVYRRAKKRNLDEIEAITTMLVACIGVFLGMHLLYGLTMLPYVQEIYQASPPFESFSGFLQFVISVFGGSVFYGGLFGGMAAGFLYLRKKKLPLREYTDLIAVIIPFFHLFGRIGCFLGGCCYGIPSDFGFTYTHSPNIPANGVKRFPVQLLEALCLLVLFLILLYLYEKRRFPGNILLLYLSCYAVLRFFLEFLRGDQYRGFLWGFSTSQIISVLLFAACCFWVVWQKVRKRASS